MMLLVRYWDPQQLRHSSYDDWSHDAVVGWDGIVHPMLLLVIVVQSDTRHIFQWLYHISFEIIHHALS